MTGWEAREILAAPLGEDRLLALLHRHATVLQPPPGDRHIADPRDDVVLSREIRPSQARGCLPRLRLSFRYSSRGHPHRPRGPYLGRSRTVDVDVGRQLRLGEDLAGIFLGVRPTQHPCPRLALTGRSRKRLDYALTGDAGANAYLSSAGEAWPVLYVEDVVRSARAAQLARKEPGSFGLRITLIPFDGVSELGRRKFNGITVASRDQVIIDAYGGVDRMPEQADLLMGQRVA